jgi:hypothetical protein
MKVNNIEMVDSRIRRPECQHPSMPSQNPVSGKLNLQSHTTQITTISSQTRLTLMRVDCGTAVPLARMTACDLSKGLGTSRSFLVPARNRPDRL